MVTSQVRLGVSSEHEVPVEPLALPGTRSTADIPEASAVRLFVDRARAVHLAFVLSERNTTPVANICERLDGLPLAIELAAAWSSLLSPEALAARVARRLNVMTGGPHDAPARHQTMRAAIAWSYDLLGNSERRFWERLGALVGGVTAEAADAVGRDQTELELDCIATLQSLIDKVLVRPAASRTSELRFQMLETTSEFAMEQLAVPSEVDAVRAAYTRWFHTYAGTLEPGPMGYDPDRRFDRAEADIASLRAALGWFRDRGQAAAALEVVSSLGWFWTTPTYSAEGRECYAELLARADPDLVRPLRVKALQVAGDLAIWHGDADAALALLEKAVMLWSEDGDQARIAATLRSLCSVATDWWAFGKAGELLEEAFLLSRESDHGCDAAAAANLLGGAQ